MDSPGLRAPPPKNSPTQGQLWIPFHVVHLAGNALDECRRHIQQELHHRRGRATDPPVQGPQGAAHQILTTHRAPAAPDTQPIFRRRARRTRGHVERLPEHHRRLPRAQHERGQGPDASRNRTSQQRGRA